MHDRDRPLANQCPNFVQVRHHEVNSVQGTRHTFFQSLQVYTICSANRRINCGNAGTKLWCQLWQQRKKMPSYISSNNDSVHWISHWFPLNKPLVQLQQSHIPATIIYETFRKGIVLTPACTNQSEMLDMQVFLFFFFKCNNTYNRYHQNNENKYLFEEVQCGNKYDLCLFSGILVVCK